jgi:8-oxo-dGTP diphosphatase
MNNKPLLVVVSGILIQNNRIFFQKRPLNKSMPGLWELPGGKIEKYESPENTLARELYEELDINIDVDSLLPFNFISYAYNNFNLLMTIFIVKKWKRQIISKENQEINFFSYEELKKLKMVDADKNIVSSIHQLLMKI